MFPGLTGSCSVVRCQSTEPAHDVARVGLDTSFFSVFFLFDIVVGVAFLRWVFCVGCCCCCLGVSSVEVEVGCVWW